MGDYKKDMGLRLKDQRRKYNFTQEQMAEKLEISLNHYSEAERGIKGLSVENLIKVSDILDLSLDFLLKGRKSDALMLTEIAEVLKACPNDKKLYLLEIIKLGSKLYE